MFENVINNYSNNTVTMLENIFFRVVEFIQNYYENVCLYIHIVCFSKQ